MKYKKYSQDSYDVYTIQTDKFKNCYMEIRFRQDIRNVNLTRRHLLARAMQYTSLKYPTKREMTIALEELYNLSFSSDVFRIGYNHFTSFAIDFLHPKFVTDKQYLHQVLHFFFEVLCHPNIKDGSFDNRSVMILKEEIHATLEQYKERPLSFARTDSMQRLFKDSVSGERILGTHEELEHITNEELVSEYHELFENARCEILLIGDLDMDSLVKEIANIFYKPSIVLETVPDSIINPIGSFMEEKIESAYNQTQLLCYYQFKELTSYERDFVGPIFSRIFGSANMTDKLTTYLRIQNSLCYYCGFSLNFSNSYGVVYVGLNKKEVKKAKTMIVKAMKEMMKGEIDKEYFEQQKEKFLADLKIREDDIYGLIDTYYFHEVFGKALHAEYYDKIPIVSIQDLQNFAKKLELTYCYILEEGES